MLRNNKSVLFACLFLIMSWQKCSCQNENSAGKSTTAIGDPLEIDGLVVDETQTKVGRDFYEIYFSNWEPPVGVKDYTIVISERALPRMGSMVSVSINEILIYQNFIKPRFDEIVEATQSAIQVTLQFLYNYEQFKQDLEGEDMSGSGIY